MDSLGVRPQVLVDAVSQVQLPSQRRWIPFMSDTQTMQLTLEEVKKLAGDHVQAGSQAMALIATLQSEDEELRAWTSDVLQALAAVPEGYAPQLAEYCTHSNPVVAGWACKLLAKEKESADQYQEAITRALVEHSEIGVRQEAAAALAHVPHLSDSSLHALQLAATNHDPRLSRLAAAALAEHKK